MEILQKDFELFYSSSSENNSEIQEEDIDELIRNSRQVLRESGQTDNPNSKVPYKYTKEQAITKLKEIAKIFVLENLPHKGNADFPKLKSSDFVFRDGSFLSLQDGGSDSSEDELIIMNQPKRTLPSASHLFMRKELRMKAKRMANERKYRYSSKQIDKCNDVEQEENSNEDDGLNIQSQEEHMSNFGDNQETMEETLETESYDTVDATQPDTSTLPSYINHTKRTFGK
ncbi:hypothetical protein GpartN1_g7340.t1 [Galdieria partita]|uniref:Uncharacterized protein n=1 Tax=Galdieria partita TaxID=83374 RepID=A0A9C7UTN8_9RHOD|nr:hypothetical protein GpartN1_g7340.t1 [Galdieria partita]